MRLRTPDGRTSATTPAWCATAARDACFGPVRGFDHHDHDGDDDLGWFRSTDDGLYGRDPGIASGM